MQQAVAAIRGETRVGATELTTRAGALLVEEATERAAAGRLTQATLAGLARALVRAQPAMASICRLANAVLLAAHPPTAEAVARAVAAYEADARTAARDLEVRGAELVPNGGTVVTLSASSLVERAIVRSHDDGRRFRVLCLEARPKREGAALAARLAAAGVATELWVDAAAARCVTQVSVVLVGADTIAPAGLVHKVGTLGLALAARHYGVPAYALAGTEKMLPVLVAGALDQRRPRGEVARGAPRTLTVANYYFDLTPLDLLAGVVTEGGMLAPEQASGAAAAVGLHPLLRLELAHSAPPEL